MTPIESLLNLGRKTGHWPRETGITTIAELERLGPVVAYQLVKNRQPQPAVGTGSRAERDGMAGTD